MTTLPSKTKITRAHICRYIGSLVRSHAQALDTPESRLWIATIEQGLVSIFTGNTDPTRGGEYRKWLGSHDYEYACRLVGIDPDALAEAFKEAESFYWEKLDVDEVGQNYIVIRGNSPETHEH